MKKTQKFTPKYWVVHDETTDDVFIDTLRKTQTDSIEVFAEIYGPDEWLKNENTRVILVEINEVDPKFKSNR